MCFPAIQVSQFMKYKYIWNGKSSNFTLEELCKTTFHHKHKYRFSLLSKYGGKMTRAIVWVVGEEVLEICRMENLGAQGT